MRALLIALALAACKRAEEAPPTPAEISIAPGAAFSALRTGDAPMLRGPGDLFVFVTTARSADRMPGIALGSEDGPELALLAGEFAPLLVPDRTDLPHRVRIEARGSTLAIDFGGAFSAKVDRPGDRIRIAVEGRANVVLPAGQTTVTGFRGGHPSFSEKVNAWSEATIEMHAADRLEVETERRGAIVITTDCAPRLIRPRARANTSSFLVRLGPAREDGDPSYAPAGAVDRAPSCTGTATISLARP